jgi:hypothetical protein
MPDDVRLTGNAPGTTTELAIAPVVTAEPAVVAPEPVVVAPVEQPVVAPAVQPVVQPVVAPEPLPTDQPTLFAQFDKKQEQPKTVEVEPPKTVEVKAEEAPKVEVKTEEVEKPVEAKVEAPPVKFVFKLPDTITLPAEHETELQGLLNAFHREPNDANVQKLVDFHIGRLQDYANGYRKAAFQAFADVRGRWSKEVMADPFIGGANHDEAMQSIADVRDAFVSRAKEGTKRYEDDKKAFDEFLDKTGAGDNPSFLRFVHNISRVLNEPQLAATQEIRPIVQESNGGRPSIYKHPTSLPRR